MRNCGIEYKMINGKKEWSLKCNFEDSNLIIPILENYKEIKKYFEDRNVCDYKKKNQFIENSSVLKNGNNCC